MRRVALIILYDEDNRLLLQHRSEDAPTLPGFWGFFGGDIEASETPLQAVHRETLEELEYKLERPTPLIEPELVLPNGRIKAFIYIERLRTTKSQLVLREGQGMGWFRPPEHRTLKMMSHDREIIERVSAHLNSTENTASPRI